MPDEEYEGDDERGAISTFKTPAMKHDPTDEDLPRLETKIGGIDRQVSRSKHARKTIAKPASGNQEPGGQGRGYITTGDGPMGLGFGVMKGRRKGKGKGKAGGDIVARS